MAPLSMFVRKTARHVLYQRALELCTLILPCTTRMLHDHIFMQSSSTDQISIYLRWLSRRAEHNDSTNPLLTVTSLPPRWYDVCVQLQAPFTVIRSIVNYAQKRRLHMSRWSADIEQRALIDNLMHTVHLHTI